jgi:hypothetical protein
MVKHRVSLYNALEMLFTWEMPNPWDPTPPLAAHSLFLPPAIALLLLAPIAGG